MLQLTSLCIELYSIHISTSSEKIPKRISESTNTNIFKVLDTYGLIVIAQFCMSMTIYFNSTGYSFGL